MDAAQLEKMILESIDQRYRAQAGRDLADYIFSNHLFQSPQPEWLDFSYRHRQELAGYLSDEGHVDALVQYCMRATKSYTYQRNQFINYTRQYDELLHSEYSDFLSKLRAAMETSGSFEAFQRAYSSALKEHHERLRLILSSYCVSYLPSDLRENPLLNSVPSDQYSAQFQMRLLNIELTRLMEPILDVGCGESGGLVNYLRSKGLQASGVDRLAPVGPHFFQADWFEFDYGLERWGTITAHQSLSTHFIHAHLHGSRRAEEFARLYMRLLSSLKIGGSFYYTPGLPFIEEHLGNLKGYSMTKTTIEAGNALGIGEVFYSVRVKRGLGDRAGQVNALTR
jgi:hypothetical protein